MGVSKESISKFLIGNRFHVKLRILSPENCKQSLQVKSWKAEVTAEKKLTQNFSLLILQPFNFSPVSFACNFQDWGCVILREIDFLLKICWSIPCLGPSWKVHTWYFLITVLAKSCFHSFEREKLKFTTFCPHGKIFLATSEIIHYWPSPGKIPSDAHAPCPFIKGTAGAEVPFHECIIGNFMVCQDRIETNLLQLAAIRAPRNQNGFL